MGPLEIVRKTAEDSHGFTLPGWEPERLALLEKTLKQYENIGPDDQRKNFKYFLDNILITKGCIGRRIGIPQRIRVTTWNQA